MASHYHNSFACSKMYLEEQKNWIYHNENYSGDCTIEDKKPIHWK